MQLASQPGKPQTNEARYMYDVLTNINDTLVANTTTNGSDWLEMIRNRVAYQIIIITA